MENAALLEAEASAAAFSPEVEFDSSRKGSTVLEQYLRSRENRTRPHVVEPGADQLETVRSPLRIRVREVAVRYGPIIVFAAAVAGILRFWPPF